MIGCANACACASSVSIFAATASSSRRLLAISASDKRRSRAPAGFCAFQISRQTKLPTLTMLVAWATEITSPIPSGARPALSLAGSIACHPPAACIADCVSSSLQASMPAFR